MISDLELTTLIKLSIVGEKLIHSSGKIIKTAFGETVFLVLGEMKLYIKEPQEFDAWDIIEIFNNEMKTNNIDKYVVFLKNDLSEQEITSLYEYCDIGINTCEGEGFGLCNYEHAYHGKPQIMPNFPQFSGLYPEGSIYYIEPKHEYYIENRDANGGLAKVVDYQDVGEAILKLSSTDVYNTYTKNLNNFKKKSYKETSELFMNYIK